MLEYILGLFTLLSFYQRVNFYLIKRKFGKRKKVEIIKGAEPYLIKRGKIGVLLIHGFTATPQEFSKLAGYLSKKDITVYAPLLPGHGTTPEQLFSVKSEDWIFKLEESIALMEKFCDKIYVIGNSFGGNLGFLVTNRSSKIKGVVSIAAPFFFIKDPLARTIVFFMRQIKVFKRKNYSQKIKEINQKNGRISYQDIPLYSMKEFLKTVKNSKKILPEIKKKVLVIQSSEDEVVSRNSPAYICQNISSKSRSVVWIPESYHVLIIDKNKNLAFKEIYKFVK